MKYTFALLSLLFASPTVILAQEADATKVYLKVLPSVVWIHSARPNGSATGTGTVIDAEKRIVLTNYHVVEETPNAKVMFAKFRDGAPIAEKKYYRDRLKQDGIDGRVIAKDKQADLALIRLESLPRDVKAVPLAAKGALPGLSVHSIGNTGKSDALWGYVPGKVRQVYEKKWKAKLDERRIIEFRAKVVETDSPTNPGDSGGPLVNDAGELVGVTQGGALDAQLVSTFVDLSEVKRLLKSEHVGEGRGTTSSTAKLTPTSREKPVSVRDEAKLFREETVKELQASIDKLHREKQLDVLIETAAAAPKDDLDRVKAMKPADRTAYMKTWLQQRVAAETVTGVAILICNDPKSFYVDITTAAESRFPSDFNKKIIERLMDGLKTNKRDEAIAEIVKQIGNTAKSSK